MTSPCPLGKVTSSLLYDELEYEPKGVCKEVIINCKKFVEEQIATIRQTVGKATASEPPSPKLITVFKTIKKQTETPHGASWFT